VEARRWIEGAEATPWAGSSPAVTEEGDASTAVMAGLDPAIHAPLAVNGDEGRLGLYRVERFR
jgi:hypothetical protein